MKFLGFFLFQWLLASLAFAGVEQLSEPEFRALAGELAPKVNLFADAWKLDPAAEFYGGTTRDYLYWLKGRFRDAHSRADAERVIAELRKRPLIDVREFILSESDVDVLSEQAERLVPADYGVRKIDSQSREILDPATELGRNELHQGYVPAEKVRLGREGLQSSPGLGDGVKEIYSGNLTVHFPDPAQFRKTKFAKEGLNHEILLALRYLRLLGVDYFQTHGDAHPNPATLFAHLDPRSAAEVKRVLDRALDGKELVPFLEKPKFRSWLNGTLGKAFRSYTNPTAAKMLMDHFGVNRLESAYPGLVDSTDQYLLSRQWDEPTIAQHFSEYGAEESRVLLAPAKEFPDGYLYHGTRTPEAFRNIIFQGILTSEDGNGGRGVYGVNEVQRKFAENWAGNPNFLLRLPVKKNARIADLTDGPGQELWEKFLKKRPGASFDQFADFFGVDILAYPYTPRAYVVKNSAALGKAQGVHRRVMPMPAILEEASKTTDGPAFLKSLELSGLSRAERVQVMERLHFSEDELQALLKEGEGTLFLRYVLADPRWRQRTDLAEKVLDSVGPGDVRTIVQEYLPLLPPERARPLLRKAMGLSGEADIYLLAQMKKAGRKDPELLGWMLDRSPPSSDAFFSELKDLAPEQRAAFARRQLARAGLPNQASLQLEMLLKPSEVKDLLREILEHKAYDAAAYYSMLEHPKKFGVTKAEVMKGLERAVSAMELAPGSRLLSAISSMATSYGTDFDLSPDLYLSIARKTNEVIAQLPEARRARLKDWRVWTEVLGESGNYFLLSKHPMEKMTASNSEVTRFFENYFRLGPPSFLNMPMARVLQEPTTPEALRRLALTRLPELARAVTTVDHHVYRESVLAEIYQGAKLDPAILRDPDVLAFLRAWRNHKEARTVLLANYLLAQAGEGSPSAEAILHLGQELPKPAHPLDEWLVDIVPEVQERWRAEPHALPCPEGFAQLK